MKKWMLTGMLAAMVLSTAGCCPKDVAREMGWDNGLLQQANALGAAAAQFPTVLAVVRTVAETWLVTTTGVDLGSSLLSLLTSDGAPTDPGTLSVCVE